MILPYFNCLVVSHTYSSIEIGEAEEHLIKDYLEEALRSRKQVGTTILISNLGDRNSSLVLRMHNILHMLITNLGIEVHELSNSYTQSEQFKLLYDALEQIRISSNQGAKIPLLENISPLQSYYCRYSSQQEMKEFLKRALIEELNADKKIIRYRTSEQVQSFLKRQAEAIQGEIKVSSGGSPIAEDIFVLLVSHKQAQPETLIELLERHYPINKEINASFTSRHTLSGLQQKAQEKLSSLFAGLFKRQMAVTLSEISSLKASMLLHCSLAGILVLGGRLREEEVQREQFLDFVSQMNAKYTKELSVYFLAFRQQLLHRSRQQQYRERLKHHSNLQAYLLGFSKAIGLERKQQSEAQRKCWQLEKAITAFLLRRRARNLHLELYLAGRREERARTSAMYEDIRKLLNEMELAKVRKYNGHKYGFSCCLFMLELSCHSNSPCFSPMLLLKQLQKLSKRKEPLARINCHENMLEFITIEGKVLRLGKSLPHPFEFDRASQKENLESNYASIVEQLVPSQAFPLNLEREKTRNIHSFQNHRERSEEETDAIRQFQSAHPSESIVFSAAEGGFGVLITSGGKLLHWGKGRPPFPQCRLPQPAQVAAKIIPKQAAIGTEDLFVLSASNKVYSSLHRGNVRLPKQVEQEFDQFHLIKSGGANLSVCYLLAYRSESQDKLKQRQIRHFLTSPSLPGRAPHDSLLVDSSERLGQIQEISSILEESLSC